MTVVTSAQSQAHNFNVIRYMYTVYLNRRHRATRGTVIIR